MKVIKPFVEILDQEPTVDGALKMAEMCARTCYASTDKMGTVDTKAFVDNLIKSGHGEPVECNAVYLMWDLVTEDYDHDRYNKYKKNEYSRVKTYENDTKCYITTNYRVIVDNGWEEDLKYICEPTDKHELRISVRFGTQIVIASEVNRYRKNSKGQRSTRYCNFSKEKYGNEISISMPNDPDITEEGIENCRQGDFYDYVGFINSLHEMGGFAWSTLDGEKSSDNYRMTAIDWWWFANLTCQEAYMHLTQEFGWKAQRARRILPLDTHTEMIHTAYLSDWKHFIAQRSDETTGPAHPDIKIIADDLKKLFIEKGYIKADEILK